MSFHDGEPLGSATSNSLWCLLKLWGSRLSNNETILQDGQSLGDPLAAQFEGNSECG